MNSTKLRKWLGDVTCIIEGESVEKFLYECAQASIPLREVKLLSKTKIEANFYVRDMKKVRKIASDLHMRLELDEETGLFVYLRLQFQETYKIVAFVLSFILLFILSHTTWNVHMKHIPYHLEKEITAQLQQLNIYPGSFQFKAPPVEQIEQILMENVPQLLYISVKKRGTIYTIEALEKIDEDMTENTSPSHLIAEKNGIIKKMLIERGQAVVNVNDFVQKGDLLVSGELIIQDEIEGEEEEKEEGVYVRSIGDIYANTWYEVKVSADMSQRSYHVAGNYVTHYELHIGSLRIPVKFWPRLKDKQFTTVEEVFPLRIFNVILPIKLVEKRNFEQTEKERNRTEEETKEIAIEHALEDLQHKLGKETEIVKYYVLHEVVDNGKVKLRLYVSAIENIAREQPIKNEQLRD